MRRHVNYYTGDSEKCQEILKYPEYGDTHTQALVLVQPYAYWGTPEMEATRTIQMLVPIHQFT